MANCGRMVRDSAVVTMESYRKPPCSFEWYDQWPPTTSPSPKGGIKCTAHPMSNFKWPYLCNRSSDPLHASFKVGFSGSVDRMALFLVLSIQDGGHDKRYRQESRDVAFCQITSALVNSSSVLYFPERPAWMALYSVIVLMCCRVPLRIYSVTRRMFAGWLARIYVGSRLLSSENSDNTQTDILLHSTKFWNCSMSTLKTSDCPVTRPPHK